MQWLSKFAISSTDTGYAQDLKYVVTYAQDLKYVVQQKAFQYYFFKDFPIKEFSQ